MTGTNQAAEVQGKLFFLLLSSVRRAQLQPEAAPQRFKACPHQGKSAVDPGRALGSPSLPTAPRWTPRPTLTACSGTSREHPRASSRGNHVSAGCRPHGRAWESLDGGVPGARVSVGRLQGCCTHTPRNEMLSYRLASSFAFFASNSSTVMSPLSAMRLSVSIRCSRESGWASTLAARGERAGCSASTCESDDGSR